MSKRDSVLGAGGSGHSVAIQAPPTGLTLLELVVVGIIGVLAALAVPGLAAAKRAARRTACLNNLKQLQLCWQLYVTDHDDAVPPNGSLMTNGVWRSTPDSWIGFSSAPHDADTRAIEQGLLYRSDYNRKMRLYHCSQSPLASQRQWLHRCPSDIESRRTGGSWLRHRQLPSCSRQPRYLLVHSYLRRPGSIRRIFHSGVDKTERERKSGSPFRGRHCDGEPW